MANHLQKESYLMSTQGTRIRARYAPSVPAGTIMGNYFKWDGAKWAKYGSELTQSPNYQGNVEYCRDQTNPGPPYLSGGPFTSLKGSLSNIATDTNFVTVNTIPNQISFPEGMRYVQFVGRFYNPNFSGFDPNEAFYGNIGQWIIQPGVFPSLSSYYASASKKLRPHLEKAGLAVAIAEMREIPRMLRQTGKLFSESYKALAVRKNIKLNNLEPFMTPKRVADDFLNEQFGWMPFVKDVSDACKVTLFAHDYIAELTAKNNQWDHRECIVEEIEEDIDVLASGTGMKVQPNSYVIDAMCTNASRNWQIQKVVKQQVWASGDYKFYRPEFDASLSSYNSNFNKLRQYLILYGIRINPSILYKITPWTWLIDWFTNTGDVIDELSQAGQDGLVSKNLYLMCRRVETIRLIQSIPFTSGTRTLSFERIISSKQRAHAGTPFGFGLLNSDLSAKQWTILGSLGISKFL
jgi:hypothetical protein